MGPVRRGLGHIPRYTTCVRPHQAATLGRILHSPPHTLYCARACPIAVGAQSPRLGLRGSGCVQGPKPLFDRASHSTTDV